MSSRADCHRLLTLIEDELAQVGVVVMSRETAELFVTIKRRLAIGATVPPADFEAVLYAVYAGPYGDYHQAQVFA